MAVTFQAGPLLNKGIPALTEPTIEVNDTVLRGRGGGVASITLLGASFLLDTKTAKELLHVQVY